MSDEVKKNLIDILQAAEEIGAFVHGMDFKAYQNSLVTQRAVERDFEIIGEALNRIRKIVGNVKSFPQILIRALFSRVFIDTIMPPFASLMP